jgi:hypothetical protein
MSKASPTSGLVELWVGLEEAVLADASITWRYRPALLFECLLEFRDPRAEIVHSEDRRYTTWLPRDDAAADWSVSAVGELAPEHVRTTPQPEVRPYGEAVTLTDARVAEIEDDFIAHVVRTERVSVYYNPNLRLYSRWNESREEFLERATEEARLRLQPTLRELMREFQFQLEQLRQKPLPPDIPEELRSGVEVQRRRMISRLEARLHRVLLDHPSSAALRGDSTEELSETPSEGDIPQGIADELHPLAQELERLYAVAAARAQALLREAFEKARECEPYTIALHPSGIRILRRALLWVPTPE